MHFTHTALHVWSCTAQSSAHPGLMYNGHRVTEATRTIASPLLQFFTSLSPIPECQADLNVTGYEITFSHCMQAYLLDRM